MTKKLASLVLLFIVSVFYIFSENKQVYLYQVDPLVKVLKERNYFRDEIDTIRVARGEVASIQIVAQGMAEINNMQATVTNISSGPSKLTEATTGWVGYVRVGRSYNPPSKVGIRLFSRSYPA